MRGRSLVRTIGCVVLGVWLLGGGVARGECEIESAALMGYVDFGDVANDVIVSGSYAYVATGAWDTDQGALQVVDVSDPMSPEVVGFVGLGGFPYQFTISGSLGYVFVQGSAGGLFVVDLSDPFNPEVIGSLDGDFYLVNSVAVSGSYLYMADEAEGLLIVDVSDPTNPGITGSLEMPGGRVLAMATSGDYLHLTFQNGYPRTDGEFRIMDISDPTSPSLVSSVGTTFPGCDLVVFGSYAYVAMVEWGGMSGGLVIVDISDPASPSITGTFASYPCHLAVSGSYAYIPDWDRLQVVDVSDPSLPYLVNETAAIIWGTSVEGIYDVAASGSYVYFTYQASGRGNGLQIVDVSNQSSLHTVGSTEGLYAEDLYYDMAISGSLAYLVGDTPILEIIDVSDISAPVLVGSLDTLVSPLAVDVSEPYAYVADGSGGLQIVDATDPAAPYILSNLPTSDGAFDVAASGQYAYMAAKSEGLLIVDISDPSAPSVVGAFDAGYDVYDVALSGSYVCVGGGGPMYMVDISDPTDPQVAGSVALPRAPHDIEASSGVAIVSYSLAPVMPPQIIDISNPTQPEIVSTLSIPGNIADIAINGSYGFIAGGGDKVYVLDLSIPAAPRSVASFSAGFVNAVQAVAVSGSYTYAVVADMWSSNIGFQVVRLCPDLDPNPTIGITPASLTVSNNQGEDPPNQSFEVWNAGDGQLDYLISSDVPWLDTVDYWPDMAYKGSSTGEHDTIELSFGTYRLSPGEHTGRIIIADPRGINSPQIIDVTANVAAVPQTLDMSVSPAEGGTATGGGTYNYYEFVEIEAHPNAGWEFDHWEGDIYSSQQHYNPTYIRMDADRSITAVFAPITYELTTDVSPADAGFVTGGGTCEYGETVFVEVSPNPLWQFDHWEGDDINGSTNNPEQLEMYADKSVTAVFAPVPLTRIHLTSPADQATFISPPSFSWTADGGLDNIFVVDLAFSPNGPIVWSTHKPSHQFIRENTWTMPMWVWSKVPWGRRVYWRVRGMDLDGQPRVVVTSDEVWSFRKQ